MKKNIRDYKVNGNQFSYGLDAINVIDCEGNEIEATDKERVKYFFDTYNSEYNKDYNKRLYPDSIERLSSYLQGLPSCIDIAFTYQDIEKIGKSWGYCENEKETERFINSWFKEISVKLLLLRQYFKL